jgi:hypothetical protein
VVAVEEARFLPLGNLVDVLSEGSASVEVQGMADPQDCTDGFGEVFCARPAAFLQPALRTTTSGRVLTDPQPVRRGLD